MWKALLAALGWGERLSPAPPDTVAGLIARLPDLRELLAGLGYNAPQQAESTAIMMELKSLVRAEIIDFAALQAAIVSAVARREELPERISVFLRALASAADAESATAVLNADPVHDHVPFVEQIPVVKNGAVTWRAPVRHSLIRKCTSDLPRFRDAISRLEALFVTQHPARTETARVAVLDAIERLLRELDREQPYLPSPLEVLEGKLNDYYVGSLKPRAVEWLQTLMSILERVVDLRNAVQTGECGEARPVAEQAVRYLANPRIQTPGLTSYLLVLLLHRKLRMVTRRISRPNLRTMELVGNEIAGGYYDGAETVRRLRRLEGEGFYVASVVYPLLELPASGKLT